MMRTTSIRGIVLLLISIATPLVAQQQNLSCDGPEYRQFDFWIGEWSVFDQRSENPNQQPSKNVITSQSNGCVILEQWRPGLNGAGISINYFDRTDRKWHQHWIDSSGRGLVLSGGIEDGAMVMTSGGQPLNRVSWTPREDGSVRQLWETSSDGGATWTTTFDGLYTKKTGG